ncbi:MAG: (2Fe-2S)-binding protein [Syntrophaceae bacterium]|nr:(2Fe-2S)-binding protein [Syntrophaceae bacterium]
MPDQSQICSDLISISFVLNGKRINVSVDPSETALMALREDLCLTGTKEGCGIGECGACSIIVDGKVVNSCLTLAAQLDGREVMTVEGIASDAAGQCLQRAFAETGGVQCGFCTPGMLLSSYALLKQNPNPSREQIIEAISGNICRCTGYIQIIEAIEKASTDLLNSNSEEK